MKKLLLLLPAFILAFYSCGDKPAESVKKDSVVDSSATVKTPPAKPVEKLDPADSVFDWVKTIDLNVAYGLDFGLVGNNIVFSTRDKDSSLHMVDKEGKLVHAFGSIGRSDSAFRDFPDQIALGPGGNIFVSDGTQPRVVVFDSTGKFIRQIKIGGGVLIAGIAVNSQGTLFVSSAVGWMLKAYDASGNFVRDIKDIKNKGGVAWGYFADVAVDSSDRIYVCNWRSAGSSGNDAVVHECDKDGAYLTTIPLLLDHNVVMFTVDPAGRLFADALNGVVVFSHDGRKMGRIDKNGKDGKFEAETISAMQVDKAGYVYVLTKGRIEVYR